jgi:signal peptidase II
MTDASGRPGSEVNPIGGAESAEPAAPRAGGTPPAAASFDAPRAGESPPAAAPFDAPRAGESPPAAASFDAPHPTPPAAPLSRLGVFALVAAVVVGLDHLTKYIVIQNLPFHRDIPVFGEWVMLTHIKNTGGAFGLFPGSTLPLIIVSSVASIVLCVLAVRLRHDWTRLMALALILGGAIGNLIDRVVAGKVTDFIHVGIPDGPRWPIFNVADSAVSIGVVILGFLVYFRRHEEADTAGAGRTTGADAPTTGGAERTAGADGPTTAGAERTTGADAPSTGGAGPTTGADGPSTGGAERTTGADASLSPAVRPDATPGDRG